jgi:hypothetical protein
MKRLVLATLSLAALLSAATTHAADPWAYEAVRYTPGTAISPDFVTGDLFDKPLTALGAPTRITSLDSFPSAVTPLSAPFRSTEVVTVGGGGELVVKFDEPVTDDPLNPFGIDLLVFGNAFFQGTFGFPFNPAGVATGVEAEGGLIEVSADDSTYVAVTGAADGLFPTNGFTDVPDPYGSAVGTMPTDFTRPVDPTFNPIGKTFAEIIAGYGGSGGGLGIDLAATGLASISYVRITTPAGVAQPPEIDAFADVRAVPEPAALEIIFAGALILLGKTARRGNVNAAT